MSILYDAKTVENYKTILSVINSMEFYKFNDVIIETLYKNATKLINQKYTNSVERDNRLSGIKTLNYNELSGKKQSEVISWIDNMIGFYSNKLYPLNSEEIIKHYNIDNDIQTLSISILSGILRDMQLDKIVVSLLKSKKLILETPKRIEIYLDFHNFDNDKIITQIDENFIIAREQGVHVWKLNFTHGIRKSTTKYKIICYINQIPSNLDYIRKSEYSWGAIIDTDKDLIICINT